MKKIYILLGFMLVSANYALFGTVSVPPQNSVAFGGLVRDLKRAVEDQHETSVSSLLNELTQYNFRKAILEGIPQSSEDTHLLKVDVAGEITDALDQSQKNYKDALRALRSTISENETNQTVINDRKQTFQTAKKIKDLVEKAYEKIIFDSL